jgi:soluble cytochrome b562
MPALKERVREVARNDTAVKIETEIVRQGRTIAARRNITLAEYLSDILRSTVAKDYREVVQQMAAEIDTPRRKPKGGDL